MQIDVFRAADGSKQRIAAFRAAIDRKRNSWLANPKLQRRQWRRPRRFANRNRISATAQAGGSGH